MTTDDHIESQPAGAGAAENNTILEVPAPILSTSERAMSIFSKPFLSRKSKSFSGPEMLSAVPPPATVVLENDETTSGSSGGALKWGRARNRKKSRRMTLLQACAESVDGQTPDVTTDGSDSAKASSAGAEESASERITEVSSKDPKERKISRIFWMLQSMQQAFAQSTSANATIEAAKSDPAPTPPPPAPAPVPSPAIVAVAGPVSPITPLSKTAESGIIGSNGTCGGAIPSSGSSFRAIPPHLRSLHGLGQSEDSISGFHQTDMPLKNPIRDRLARFGSINSWAGSEYSESSLLSSSTASSAPPPLIHPVPYHKDGLASLFIVASSTYAQLLVVVCIVSVFSEVVTSHVPVFYYEGFFTYLYAVSILFFLYVFGYLLRSKRRKARKDKQRKISRWRRQRGLAASSTTIDIDAAKVGTASTGSDDAVPAGEVMWNPTTFDTQSLDEGRGRNSVSFSMSASTRGHPLTVDPMRRKTKKMKVSENEHSHGSFFLRAGAVAFGLGTMIYDGLEFGAFLEIPSDSPCYALLRGLNPVLHAIFVFFQMYFVFVSARLNIHKFKAIARFGLMHCLATNVCVWIRTLVRESLKEMQHAPHHLEKGAGGLGLSVHHAGHDHGSLHHPDNETNDTPSLWELTGNVSCGRNVFLGDVIMEAAPFLYPFLIEYSLIGAAVLYVLWAHIGLNPKYINDDSEVDRPRSKSQFRVDCLGSSKGLFIGILMLAMSLLCLVLFFVFAHQPEFRYLGLVLADGAHCALLLVSLVAMAIGVYRARHLTFHPEHIEEGGSLLRVSALGIFGYSVFSIIAGALGPWTEEPPLLVLVNGLLSLTQVAIQQLFISDMSRRRISTPEEDRTKPGRQAVTFLLIVNVTLWLVYTFEMQKVEANPVQVHFYGFLPWAVIQRITLPLCIFYRFHSAIIFAEIWKNTYRAL